MLNRKEILLHLKPILVSTLPDNYLYSASFRLAAVLIIIHYIHIMPHILLIKRSSKMRLHANEISFPGGTYIREDKSLYGTAIRETKEEIGLTFKHKDIIGSLAEVRTLTSNSIIIPFITLRDKIPKPKIHVDEVETIIDAPLIEILETMVPDTDHYHLSVEGAYKFTYRNEVIWGATARILKQLHDCLCIKHK